MSRSLLVSLSSCVFVTLLLSSTSATAQGFTEADLVGDYGFQASQSASNSVASTSDSSLAVVGRFTSDGLGGISGSRSFARSVRTAAGSSVTIETVEQDFAGTYSVDLDGTGIIVIEPTPNPDWDIPRPQLSAEFEGTETLRFVLVDGGRRLLLDLDIPVILREVRSGFEADRKIYQLEGEAASQEPSAPAPDPRIDVLTDLVARLSAQNCEVLRLLNTPQGQRETSTPEVVEACGTGYEWNAEGPRRGR